MTKVSDGHRFPLRLDGELHAALIAEAQRSGRSPSVVVRRALAAYLDQPKEHACTT